MKMRSNMCLQPFNPLALALVRCLVRQSSLSVSPMVDGTQVRDSCCDMSSVREIASTLQMDVRPNHTIYINNLNEKIKKDGKSWWDKENEHV